MSPREPLSQQDIDSLLTGGGSRNRGARRGPQTKVEVVPYNFIRPARISKERQAILNAIFSRFGVALQSYLSSRLRQAPDVTITSVEEVTFGEFLMSLADPCAAFVFDLGEKIGTQAVVDVGTGFAHHLVDRFFGGPGDNADIGRALTPLEQTVLQGMVDRAMTLLQEAAGEHLPMTPTAAGFESLPGMLQLANREDTVLTANIEIKTGSAEGLLIICMPLTALESFLQEKSGRLVSGNRSRSEDRISTRSRVELCIRQVSLPVSARMRPFGLSAEVLAGLEEGQVILTGHHAETGVELHISGLARFEGRVGQHHGHYGVRIASHSDGANTRQPKGRLLS